MLFTCVKCRMLSVHLIPSYFHHLLQRCPTSSSIFSRMFYNDCL
ncbi:hypothetical protein ACINWC323_3646 [Acinetobacter sp. WC-323]|nr:hypothetical protein ACINWC323_3646 [Acinetobacter sp. WC-323]